MDVERIAPELEKVVEASAKLGHVQTIFGDPIELGSHTIVPVGAVVTAFGAGGGGLPLVSGVGGGGELRVLPVGFLQEVDGVVQFTSIELPAHLTHPMRKHDGGGARSDRSLAGRIRRALGSRDRSA
jgi:uncharacterized spore protein YtfJ